MQEVLGLFVAAFRGALLNLLHLRSHQGGVSHGERARRRLVLPSPHKSWGHDEPRPWSPT
jgi:hypothetical protein